MAAGDTQDSTTDLVEMDKEQREKQWTELMGDKDAQDFMIERLKVVTWQPQLQRE